MGWLRSVGALKFKVSFAKEPYKRDDILQQRPTILRNLLIVATPYEPLNTVAYCHTLQHTITHCNTIRYTALHCYTRRHTVMHPDILLYTVTHGDTL